MDNDLSSILNEQEATDSGEETQVESQEQQATEGQHEAATGEETATPAVEQEQQEDEGTRRIKGLEAAAAAERRKRQQLEQELAEFRRQATQAQQTQQQTRTTQANSAEPKREEFASDPEFIRALARHEAQQLREAEKEQERQQQAEREREQHEQAIHRAAEEIVKKGQAKYRDFDSVINGGLGPFLTPTLHQALLVSDRADEVAYALGKDPLEAERIAQLPPAKMLHALGVIEARLTGEQPATRSGPSTLTQARNAQGQFQKTYGGPTPLDDILASRQ